MPDRSFNTTAIRYTFNGKEDEIFSEWQDYGFRNYDKKQRRFTSVDPLTAKYPELTPFQFASNTPIMAIDLDGLEAYFIHGTYADNEAFSIKQSDVITKNLTNNSFGNKYFSWDFSSNLSFRFSLNNVSNDEDNRNLAARHLVNYILHERKVNNVSTDEEITLIGHSHGGNVAIQAASILFKE